MKNKKLLMVLALAVFMVLFVIAHTDAAQKELRVFDVVITSVTPDGHIIAVADTPNRALDCRDSTDEGCARQGLDIARGQWGTVMGGADFSAWRAIEPLRGTLLKATWDNEKGFVAVDCGVLMNAAEKNYLLTPRGCGSPSEFITKLRNGL